MKSKLCIFLALLMLVMLCGSAARREDNAAVQDTRVFTDSLGREITVPSVIDRVAVTGPISQTYIFALCPEKITGISTDWEKGAEEYIGSEYLDLPVIGQIYGTGGDFNPETLLSSGTQIVIDIGEPKAGAAEDLDALSVQTGIPFVHITAYEDSMGNAFRKLGELLGMEERAEQYAAYCDMVYERACGIMKNTEKTDAIYVLNSGRNVLPEGSFHAEVLEFFCTNAARVESPSAMGSGNEVDMEQLFSWDPSCIFFAPDSVCEEAGSDPLWSTLQAVRDGNYYEVPSVPYNWMGLPPGAQRLLGFMWVPSLLYPEECPYDIKEEVKTYYEMFYHAAITDEQIDRLLKNSCGKVI